MTNYYVRETPDGADVLRRISVNFSALICTCYEVSTAHQIVNALKALQAPPAEQSECKATPCAVPAGYVPVSALIEAREEVESWAAYATPYFQDKHDLAEVLAKIDGQIAAAQAQQPADAWINLYRRAVDVANDLTNYVEDRPKLLGAERKLGAIENEARALIAANKENNNG